MVRNEGLEKYHGQLSNNGDPEKWRVHSLFAFMVAFFRLIVFPVPDEHIYICLCGVVRALTTMDNPTLIPVILGDMFCTLTQCKKSATYFEGCNILYYKYCSWNTCIFRLHQNSLLTGSILFLVTKEGSRNVVFQKGSKV